jgi:hypothetical protein
MKPTKSVIERQIIENTGSVFPNVNQLAKYLHMRKENVHKLMEGIDPWICGNRVKYTAADVAARIIRQSHSG